MWLAGVSSGAVGSFWLLSACSSLWSRPALGGVQEEVEDFFGGIVFRVVRSVGFPCKSDSLGGDVLGEFVGAVFDGDVFVGVVVEDGFNNL